MPARLSVVVPIAASAGHLDSCLRSLGDQSIDALDVVIVDDGAAASSLDVARGWATRDPRFRVVARTGDGSARDVGVAAARSEFLGFVNAEDVVPRRGYELLLRKLERSGADFATGNVRRLVGRSVVSEPLVASAFARSRSGVRLADVRPLIADQLITNKLWRRRLWDEHSFRLPDGDDPSADIAVVLRAHLLASSVDVVRHSVYLRRVPNGNDLATTTRLTEIEQFRRRFAGIEAVREMLGSLGPPKVVRWYDANVVRQDLPPYLNVLDIADDEYVREVVNTLRGYRGQLRASAFESLPTIDRLIWHLIGRGLVDEVVETVEFAKHGSGRTQAVRRGDPWYDDLPFRTDPALAIPADVYELDNQLMPVATVEELGWTGHRLLIRGHAHIRHLGAPLPVSQRIRICATAATNRRCAASGTPDPSPGCHGGHRRTRQPRLVGFLGSAVGPVAGGGPADRNHPLAAHAERGDARGRAQGREVASGRDARPMGGGPPARRPSNDARAAVSEGRSDRRDRSRTADRDRARRRGRRPGARGYARRCRRPEAAPPRVRHPDPCLSRQV